VACKINGHRKAALDSIQTVRKVFGHAPQQKIGTRFGAPECAAAKGKR